MALSVYQEICQNRTVLLSSGDTPVIHAGQTVSASQSDWGEQEFSLNNLNLNNVDFSLSVMHL